MQAKWGSHGDYEIIALAPSSVQESFDLTVQAFNLSEKYRVPVFVMLDEVIGHLRERLVIPPTDQLEIINRKKPAVPPEQYNPFEPGNIINFIRYILLWVTDLLVKPWKEKSSFSSNTAFPVRIIIYPGPCFWDNQSVLVSALRIFGIIDFDHRIINSENTGI
jgi:hypothetical protein